MKPKFQLALICSAFVGISIWLSWPKGEPSWGGKVLSEWLVEVYPDDLKLTGNQSQQEWEREFKERDRRQRRAQEAIRKIGAAAVPRLLECLEPAPHRSALLERVEELVGRNLTEVPSEHLLRQRAIWGFEALGASASAAVPALTLMLDKSNTVSAAASCLGMIGASGFTPLVHGLSSPKEVTRLACVRVLGACGTNASVAAPAVLAAVSDPSPVVAAKALFSYAMVEPDKQRLVATLQRMAQTHAVSPLALLNSVEALGVMRRPHGPEVQPIIEETLRLASDPDETIRIRALRSIGKYGEWAAPARPMALAAIKSTNATERANGCSLLGTIRLDPGATLPVLIGLAQHDPDEFVRFAALEGAAKFRQAGLPFCGPLRAEVEQRMRAIDEAQRSFQQMQSK